MLYGVSATDVQTYAIVTFAVGAVAALASVVPVRRALRLDPIAALRQD
jgi:ABC-type antimicrobial peptide transport system permease subunit